MLMGGLAQGLRSLVVDTMLTSARSWCSALPLNLLIFHTWQQQVQLSSAQSESEGMTWLPTRSPWWSGQHYMIPVSVHAAE
jgi:hypothetical protein